MTSQERVLLALRCRRPDRVPIHDSPWSTTEARWHKEGLPEGVSAADHFGFEIWGYWGDNSLQLETQVLEETDEFVISTGADGQTVKNWKGRTSTPELIDFSITTRELWEEHKPRKAWNETRVAWESLRKAYDAARERGRFCYLGCGPGFTRVCNIVGPERVLMAMVDDPEWIHDMLMSDAALCARIAEETLARGYDWDAGWVFDDLGFKHKGFFSPAMYERLLMPAHKLICDVFKRAGKPMMLHSCGYVTEFVPQFMEIGFDCLQPLEVKAGNDMPALKQRFGDRLCLMGGIDVRAMADPDPAAIEKEIADKLPVVKEGGGYIYHSDHSVPDNVSFEQYCRVMELVAHYGKY